MKSSFSSRSPHHLKACAFFLTLWLTFSSARQSWVKGVKENDVFFFKDMRDGYSTEDARAARVIAAKKEAKAIQKRAEAAALPHPIKGIVDIKKAGSADAELPRRSSSSRQDSGSRQGSTKQLKRGSRPRRLRRRAEKAAAAEQAMQAAVVEREALKKLERVIHDEQAVLDAKLKELEELDDDPIDIGFRAGDFDSESSDSSGGWDSTDECDSSVRAESPVDKKQTAEEQVSGANPACQHSSSEAAGLMAPLIEMGFDVESASRALAFHGGDVRAAAEALIVGQFV